MAGRRGVKTTENKYIGTVGPQHLSPHFDSHHSHSTVTSEDADTMV
jgi:hypothetical protein